MKKETIIEIIIILILILMLVFVFYKISNLKSGDFKEEQVPMEKNDQSSTSAETSGKIEVTDEQTLTGEYTTENQDESVVKTSDGGNLSLNNATVTKKGDSTNTENSEFYGVNAGVLTTKNSTTTINNANITTSGKGANAVFVTGENAKVYVKDTTIKTTGESSSRGLDSTYGGYIEADNVDISTEGGSCATLATDRGEGTGTFESKNSTLEISEDSDYYNSAPLFWVTNTKAIINLEQNTLKYGSNVLLKIEGTSEWGKSGSNGGDTTFNMTNQDAEGDIDVDNISSLEMNVKDESKLTTCINSENTAKNITLNIDSSSNLTLTGNCYVTSLTDEDTTCSNIDFNGYTL